MCTTCFNVPKLYTLPPVCVSAFDMAPAVSSLLFQVYSKKFGRWRVTLVINGDSGLDRHPVF
jgi:hypothetical protein